MSWKDDWVGYVAGMWTNQLLTRVIFLASNMVPCGPVVGCVKF
jgi:hypothetical protein